MNKLASDTPYFPGSILLCGVNWLGDAIMSMPAIQLLRQEAPRSRLTLLIKPGLRSLWEMHPAIDEIVIQASDWKGMRTIAGQLNAMQLQRAYLMPHSIRSALYPWLAHIPERWGLPGDFLRNRLVTKMIHPDLQKGRTHQSFEYADLFFPKQVRTALPSPVLRVPEPISQVIQERLNPFPKPWISLLPGAARGPAKQWSSARYAAVAKQLATATGGTMIALGTSAEISVCESVISSLSTTQGVSLAGKTSLQELTSVLSLSSLAIGNDSGGMHVAGAVDCPLVAIFGITNPAQTGPLGRRVTILQHSERKTRDIPRNSTEAQKSLDSIPVEQVYQAGMNMLEATTTASK